MSTNAAKMSKHLTIEYLQEISKTVARTFTPNGGYTMYLEGSRPQTTKDGHKSLNMITAREGSWQDMILRTLKNVTTRVSLDAGDGTTSATIIIAELYKELAGLRETMGLTIPEFTAQFNKVCAEILKYMETELRQDVTTVEEALAVTRIALNNDDELNKHMEAAIRGYVAAGGDLNNIKIALREVDHINHINTTVTKGYSIKGNILMCSNVSSMNIEDVRVVYMEQKIETNKDLEMFAKIIKKSTECQCKVMLIAPWIAPHIKDELKIIFTQYTNVMKKNPPVYIVEYSPTGGMEYKYEADNTKAYLGCVPLSVMETNLEQRLNSLPGMTAIDFTYDGDYVTFTNVSREMEGLFEDRVKELELMLPKKTFQEKNIVEMSLRKMAGNIASIEVGAYSPEERNRIHDAFEDAVVALSYAVRDGYIAASNTAVIKALAGLKLQSEIGLAIYKAYLNVLRIALDMACITEEEEQTEILNEITCVNYPVDKTVPKFRTYDLLKKDYSENIIHSFKAEKVIFSTATELVNNLLSCNQIILEDEFEASAYKKTEGNETEL